MAAEPVRTIGSRYRLRVKKGKDRGKKDERTVSVSNEKGRGKR